MLHKLQSSQKINSQQLFWEGFKLRHPQQGFGSEDSMENMTDVGQPTLNRNQQTRELEALMVPRARARNRELGGGRVVLH